MFKQSHKIFRPHQHTVAERWPIHCFSLPTTLRRPLATAILMVVCASLLAAEEIVRSVNPTTAKPGMESPLAALVSRSEIIFSGQVVSIKRSHVQHWITLRFNIETVIRGSAPGLFEANFVEGIPAEFPLRPGERIVVFLHGRNAAGLTSFAGNGCGLFERTGGDRVDLGRLHFCPALHHSSLAYPPDPVVFWPVQRTGFDEKSNREPFSPIAGGEPPRTEAISTGTAVNMSTFDFLRLLLTVSNSLPTIHNALPEARAMSGSDLSGVH